jgi:hypothetical protein
MSKISYSRYKRFLQCPQLDKYHSVDKLRPSRISSDLVFGVAIDTALNALLLKTGDPIEVFQNEFDWAKLQSVNWDIKDQQYELFTTEELHLLANHPEEYLVYACLRRKGRIMIETYVKTMLPRIREVHHVQKTLNSRPGILDAILTIDGHGLVLADHKTARQPYSPDAIENDTQLALYASDQNIQRVAYIVLCKTFRFIKVCIKCGRDGSNSQHKTCAQDSLGVRCHGAFERQVDTAKILQLIVADTPKINQELINESITKVEGCIERGEYYKNLSACGNQYGKRCPYFNKCWKNDETGLEIKPETKEKK